MIRAHQQSSERCLANTTSGNSHLRPIDVYSFGILVATVFNQTEPGDLSSSAVMVGVLGVLGGQLHQINQTNIWMQPSNVMHAGASSCLW
jgi:hypothetical protein